MLKVCMVVHQYYYRDGRVRRYAESLVGAGAEVDVVCLRDPSHPATTTTDAVRVFTIPLSKSSTRRGGQLVEYALALLLFSFQLLALYLKNRYDVIHVHNMPDFLIFSALIPRLLGAKLILDVHDPMPEFYMSKFGQQRPTMSVRLMRLQERLAAAFAHAVIAANANFKASLERRGIAPRKITVVRNVADANVFSRSLHSAPKPAARDSFTLIYPGTIAPRYGLAVAIQALPLLRKDIPELRLQLIGNDGEHVRELLELADRLGVADMVEYRQTIPIDEVPGYIAAADIGIYPALPDAHMSIAIPTKVLEYAAMGTPIVASRLLVLEQLFHETAVAFFEPGDAAALAQAIRDLYLHPERRAELVRRADEDFVRTNSWAHERRTYFELLSHVAASRSGATALLAQEEDSIGEAV